MTASLPEDVQAVFDRFVTTEYTTIDRRGQPITWPVTPYYRPAQVTIDVTTGLGYPKKADDAAANPRVALLFSDPTGCGLDDPPMVLVQGTAQVDVAAVLAWPTGSYAQIKVIVSGGFSAAFQELLPELARTTGIAVKNAPQTMTAGTDTPATAPNRPRVSSTTAIAPAAANSKARGRRSITTPVSHMPSMPAAP